MMGKWDRLRPQPVPDEPETVTMAIDAMHLATDKAALEHAVADMAVRLQHAESRADNAERDRDALEVENDFLRHRMAELDKMAFPTMPLPDALQAELLLDLTDQPAAPKTPVTFPEPVEWQDVVTPSTNGTAS